MESAFPVWKQQDPRTCGAASLMVALASLKAVTLTAEKEKEIWRFANHGSKALPGTFPARLALYALQRGCDVELYEDRASLDEILSLPLNNALFPGMDLALALKEHDRYVKEAIQRGIPVHKEPLTLPSLALMGDRSKILMLVSTAQDASGLHWVLVQDCHGDGQEMVVMDPALGQNFVAPMEKFLEHYTNVHPFLGTAITLLKP